MHGDDNINSNDIGDDVVNGGIGTDEIEGGLGKDILNGGDGDDFIFHSHINFINFLDSTAHDGSQDIVNCGPGEQDEAWINESEDGDVAINCEIVHNELET